MAADVAAQCAPGVPRRRHGFYKPRTGADWGPFERIVCASRHDDLLTCLVVAAPVSAALALRGLCKNTRDRADGRFRDALVKARAAWADPRVQGRWCAAEAALARALPVVPVARGINARPPPQPPWRVTALGDHWSDPCAARLLVAFLKQALDAPVPARAGEHRRLEKRAGDLGVDLVATAAVRHAVHWLRVVRAGAGLSPLAVTMGYVPAADLDNLVNADACEKDVVRIREKFSALSPARRRAIGNASPKHWSAVLYDAIGYTPTGGVPTAADVNAVFIERARWVALFAVHMRAHKRASLEELWGLPPRGGVGA